MFLVVEEVIELKLIPALGARKFLTEFFDLS
jgi:hypothetical protein